LHSGGREYAVAHMPLLPPVTCHGELEVLPPLVRGLTTAILPSSRCPCMTLELKFYELHRLRRGH
jgi:hypothetical protein